MRPEVHQSDATDLFLLGLDVHCAGSETSASNSPLSSASVAHRGLETCGSLCLGPEITGRDFNSLAMSNQAHLHRVSRHRLHLPGRPPAGSASAGPSAVPSLDMVTTQVPLPGSRRGGVRCLRRGGRGGAAHRFCPRQGRARRHAPLHWQRAERQHLPLQGGRARGQPRQRVPRAQLRLRARPPPVRGHARQPYPVASRGRAPVLLTGQPLQTPADLTDFPHGPVRLPRAG